MSYRERGLIIGRKERKHEGFHYLVLACEKALLGYGHFLNRFRKVFNKLESRWLKFTFLPILLLSDSLTWLASV